MDKVCIAIVTFNRKNYLLKLLEKLIESSHPIDTIVIVDNASTDGTSDFLKQHKIIETAQKDKISISNWNNVRICYYLNPINSGGSGGFNKVFEIALKFEWKFLWAMDDDVWPEPDCLECLVKHIAPNALVCVPSRTDLNFEDKVIIEFNLKNPFLLRSKRKKYLKKYKDADYINIEDMPFEGPFFDRSVIEKVGLPDKKWFILFDDTDYAHRCRKYTEIHYIPKAILHKSIIPNRDKKSKYTWKQYYGLRNAMKFDMIYGETIIVRKVSPWLLKMNMYLKSIIRGRFTDIAIIKRAYYDAIHDNMGMTVKPGEF